MDIYEARRTNLRAIMNARFDGKMVALAAAVDRAQSYLSRCLTPNETHRKRIGEELARDIEAKLGLEPLSLDRPKTSDQSNVGQPIPITSPFRQIPIVGTAQLGADPGNPSRAPRTPGSQRARRTVKQVVEGCQLARRQRRGPFIIVDQNCGHESIPAQGSWALLLSLQPQLRQGFE